MDRAVASAASALRRARRALSRYNVSGYTYGEEDASDRVWNTGIGESEDDTDEAQDAGGGLNTRPSIPLSTARYIC